VTADERDAAAAAYRELVLSVGWGFHPDTPYDGYEPPIAQYTRERFEEVLDGAFAIGADVEYDPYEMGMTYLERRDAELAREGEAASERWWDDRP
jgi:hypothetical protein